MNNDNSIQWIKIAIFTVAFLGFMTFMSLISEEIIGRLDLIIQKI